MICERATWARAAPAGANTNANTIDKVANVLTSPLGVPDGGGKTEPVGGEKPWGERRRVPLGARRTADGVRAERVGLAAAVPAVCH